MKPYEVRIEFLEKPKNRQVASEITFYNGISVVRKLKLHKAIWYTTIGGRYYVFEPGTGIRECLNMIDGDPAPDTKNLLESSLRIA